MLSAHLLLLRQERHFLLLHKYEREFGGHYAYIFLPNGLPRRPFGFLFRAAINRLGLHTTPEEATELALPAPGRLQPAKGGSSLISENLCQA